MRAPVRLREGTYEAGKSHVVYYQDEQTLADAAHLYAVLKEQAPTGSPNLENDLAREFLEDLQGGNLLNNVQLAKLLDMLEKYADDIKAFRESSDDSQDILAVPDGNRAHIVK